MPEVVNGTRRYILIWALSILGTLLTAAIIGGAGMQWKTNEAVGRIESQLPGIKEADFRQERGIERLNDKLDDHVENTHSGQER